MARPKAALARSGLATTLSLSLTPVGQRCRSRGATGTANKLEPWGSLRVLWSSLVQQEMEMHGLIYLIGLIVVIMAILSFFGLR